MTELSNPLKRTMEAVWSCEPTERPDVIQAAVPSLMDGDIDELMAQLRFETGRNAKDLIRVIGSVHTKKAVASLLLYHSQGTKKQRRMIRRLLRETPPQVFAEMLAEGGEEYSPLGQEIFIQQSTNISQIVHETWRPPSDLTDACEQWEQTKDELEWQQEWLGFCTFFLAEHLNHPLAHFIDSSMLVLHIDGFTSPLSTILVGLVSCEHKSAKRLVHGWLSDEELSDTWMGFYHLTGELIGRSCSWALQTALNENMTPRESCVVLLSEPMETREIAAWTAGLFGLCDSTRRSAAKKLQNDHIPHLKKLLEERWGQVPEEDRDRVAWEQLLFAQPLPVKKVQRRSSTGLRLLVELVGEQAMPLLRGAMNDGSWQVRRQAFKQLQQLGGVNEEQIEEYLQALQSTPTVRKEAINALLLTIQGAPGPSEQMALLRTIINTPECKGRKEALATLADKWPNQDERPLVQEYIDSHMDT